MVITESAFLMLVSSLHVDVDMGVNVDVNVDVDVDVDVGCCHPRLFIPSHQRYESRYEYIDIITIYRIQ